jgi:bisphosphoglycerate-dependent phosphoglycerate mutase
MMSQEEVAALGHAEYWDKRYAEVKSENDAPTHEWFRDFKSLEPFFEKHLFESRSHDSTILHLGSGDSVCPLSLIIHTQLH